MVDQTYIGVDVAKNWLDISQGGAHVRIPATPKALRDFARQAASTCVIFEASGGYERPLMEALSKHKTPFHRVNPRQAREFARATGRLAKTDKVDAGVLADMGAALGLQPQPALCPTRQRLRDLCARIQDLKAQRRAETNRLTQTQDRFVAQDIRAMIRVIERRILRLETEIAASLKRADTLTNLSDRLQTMPGIGPRLAAELIAYLPELGRLSRRQIAALSGLAPHACDSGVFRGRRRIWGGRKEVKRALYLAGFIASRYDPKLKAFRKRLSEAGKPTKTAIIATARKLLTILNQMVKNNQDYRPEMP